MRKTTSPFLLLACILYVAVHFIPDLGGADVMGAQWFYTSVIDLLVFGFIVLNRNKYQEAIASVCSNHFTRLYTFYLIWALASVSYALNPTEAIVCLARLVSTFFIYINIAILLFNSDFKISFKQIAFIVAVVLFYDALSVIVTFSKNMSSMTLDSNIVSITGNNGNKNVMAASLLIKFPFVLYLIVQTKNVGRIAAMLNLFLGVFALFILNTRSTYVGLLIIVFLFVVTTVYFKLKSSKVSILKQLAFFIVPIILAFMAANFVLDNAIQMQEFQGGYGSVTKRIGDITVASEQNSRIHLWKAALDYFSKHPFIGDGYGNWKLASIPYEKEYTNDLFVPYHCHNDFIEAAADLGIIGALSYLGLFVMAFIFTLQIWRNEKNKEYRFFATISLMALGCYFIDAFFNFPTERTSMQTMLTLTAALIFAPSYLIKTPQAIKNGQVNKKGAIYLAIYIIAGILFIIPSIVVNKQVYESLKVQKYVMGEIDADPKMPLEEVKDAFPYFPNLSTSTLPIKALIARYEFRDKQYDEALKLLNESEKDNPYLHYNDFIKTAIYASKNNYDSTAFYAYRAFYNWPRATSYYKNALFAAAKKRDTVQINKAFNVYKKYRENGEAWNQYFLAMYEVKGGADSRMLSLMDTAIKKFPTDSLLLFNTKNILLRGAGASNQNNGQVGTFNNIINSAAKAFQKGNYNEAANLYLQASREEPNNYTHFENVAICYYSNKQYAKSIIYFEKANQFTTNTSGKSSFFKGMSFLAIGNKKSGCVAFKEAKTRNYQGVDAYISSNCN